jgi:hypothetical protein
VKVAVRTTAGEPPVAWIVTTVDEATAAEDAVRVTVAEHVGLQGLLANTEADTPDGNTVRTLKVTGAVVAPAIRVAVAVSTPPAPPAVIVNDAGVAARLKSKNCTTNVKVAVRVTTGEPPVAWIVTTVEEARLPAAAVKVTVAEHVGLQGLLANTEAVTPVGRAVRTLKVTGAVVAPANRVAVAVSTPPAPPAVMVRVDGVAARLKKSPVCTTRVKVAV